MKKQIPFLFALLFLPLFGMAQIVAEPIAPLTPIPTEEPQEQVEPEIFIVVDEEPQFPGGQTAMLRYLGKQTNYPDSCKNAGIDGKVYVQFVVETDGSISNVEVVRGRHPLLDAEAVRVVKSMPKWTPGKQSGKAVRVRVTVPFVFKLG